jgi:Domain of unknown function (DUF4190)
LSENTTTAGASPSQTRSSNGLAIAGLVCGLVGLIVFNYILGPLAIIFGGIGWSRSNDGAPHRGMAIAAVILGVVDILVYVVILVAMARHGGPFVFSR